jgi:preprotein translocase subunit SecA
MFEEMTASIQEDTVKYLLKIEVEKVPTRQEKKNYVESGSALETEQKTVVNRNASIGRNDPGPCGSGKKYKNGCGK